MNKIRLKIVGMTYSQSQTGAYALILGEVDGNRRLPIIIGGAEAQAIAIVLEDMKPSRPLTHDLFKNFALRFNVIIKEVIINKFSEGVFYAQLICDHKGEQVVIDSRTSDAVALALRFECPIYTNETVMKANGVSMEEENAAEEMESEEEEIPGNDLSNYSIQELKEFLQNAIENEEYERASLIRDEIKRRKEPDS